MKKYLSGVVCASITPMKPDGEVDYASLARLCEHLNRSGIDCLYPNGTNGESLSLTFEERLKIAREILRVNANRATVYIQCGAATVKESYENVRVARDLGADGAGLMTPVFFATDDAAMREYYENILEEITDFPIYVYNIFTRTGNDVPAALLGELMDRYENLRGIKFSYPDTGRIRDYVNSPKNRKADALIGCDMLAKECIESGGCGWVSGPSAVFPEIHVALRRAISAGKNDEAEKLQKDLTALMGSIAGIPEIPAIKYLLKTMGVIDCDVCRAPFRKLTAEECGRLDRVMADYRAKYPKAKGI